MKYANPRHNSHHTPRNGKRFAFNRQLLPTPLAYLAMYQLPAKGHGVWRDMLCPFHDDSNASLRFNSDKGAFKCMACGAKGGDILAFHMQRTGLSFIAACKDLGAWVEAE